MRRSEVTLIVTALWLTTLLPATATAESECPRARSPEQARRLAGQTFAQADALFDAGDLRGAIDMFECSYSLVAHPATLFNIGRTAEELGDRALALVTYRSYLDRFVDAERRHDVEQRVQELEQELAQETAAETDTEPEPEAPTAATPAEPSHPETPGPPTPDPDASSGDWADEHAVETRMSAARIVAWAFLPLGLAVGAVGGGLYAAAVSRNREFRAAESAGADAQDLEELTTEGQAFETASWTLVGLGGGLLVTSFVLFFAADAERPAGDGSRHRTRLEPLVGLGELGLICTF